MKRVLVIGGGAAGWLAACHLARELKSGAGGVEVTLLESPDIPTIGVGEGTVPAMRASLEHLGIGETDFLRECGATFKQGIRFVDWMRPAAELVAHAYHHPFDPVAAGDPDPTAAWLLGAAGEGSYVDAVSIQGRVCDAGRAPKLMTHVEYDGAVNYAYHLDAARFAALLTRHATGRLGVKHLLGTVGHVRVDERGHVAGVETDEFGTLDADLYVDCTGFSARLIGEALGVAFIDRSDVLFVDKALAIQVPWNEPRAAIPSETIATALAAGWVWDIGLAERRGTGYVYSSRHTSADEAERDFRGYLRESIGARADELPCRTIPMRVGYRERFWAGNCVAIGLAQGFVEPLEATGLLLFDATARLLASRFPADARDLPVLAERFNARVRYAWERVIEFIKLHYCLTDRDDSDFWRDNRAAASIPDKLAERLELWRRMPPSEYDFERREEVFSLDNYRYVLYGMGFRTDLAPVRRRYGDLGRARRDVEQRRRRTDQALLSLLPHREMIERIGRHGLQRL
ncbi:MAG TPA: tryptophan halogenase family protein [Woeseiaceae bacterium]|nr:tryptophan halogenase family protein [Woeseiaceae bacterium]